jgi:hypothetical protein
MDQRALNDPQLPLDDVVGTSQGFLRSSVATATNIGLIRIHYPRRRSQPRASAEPAPQVDRAVHKNQKTL